MCVPLWKRKKKTAVVDGVCVCCEKGEIKKGSSGSSRSSSSVGVCVLRASAAAAVATALRTAVKKKPSDYYVFLTATEYTTAAVFRTYCK